ncbi:MAG: hypothetical protein E6J02_00635 [Chloroflexi bacterium]|nr:MAG: hypothetical protein E6J02_00635 [Chloroflexota bacterium]TME16498.1 MAG: hypothetical protein E6I63_05880 [Chloroflexota bacterium]TME16667.1 MAG: hypothetical protein E6I70_11990 [Chloroflexota bacterium]
MTPADRHHRLLLLDRCLVVLEEALERGQVRVDAQLGIQLRELLGESGLVAGHRLEGRRVDRVLDDIFALQEEMTGQAS